MAKVWIARHGQVLPGQPSRLAAHGAQLYLGDPLLTPLGEQQAQALGRHARRLQFRGIVLASPYRRTLATAQIVAEHADLGVICCPEIREMVGSAGMAADFHGATIEEARRICPRLLTEADLPWPWWSSTPESREDLVARMDAAVRAGSRGGHDLLLVTHGGPMNAVTKAWLERSGEACPQWLSCWIGQVNRFAIEGTRYRCEALGDISHLHGPDQLTCNELDFSAMEALRHKAGACSNRTGPTGMDLAKRRADG